MTHLARLAPLVLLAASTVPADPASSLSLRATVDEVAVINTAGERVGAFLRPEADADRVDDELFELVDRRGDKTAASWTWRAARGYRVSVDFRIADEPARVEVSVVVEHCPSQGVVLYLPFEISRPLDTPRLVSFCSEEFDGGGIECLLPGEGLSAHWGDPKCADPRMDVQLLLPVTAVDTEKGAVITGCPESESVGFRIHRSGRVEAVRRFLADSDSSQSAAFYIGCSPRTNWNSLYQDWFARLNPERFNPTGVKPDAARRSGCMEDPAPYQASIASASSLLVDPEPVGLFYWRLLAGLRPVFVRADPAQEHSHWQNALFHGCIPEYPDSKAERTETRDLAEALAGCRVSGGKDPLTNLVFTSPDGWRFVTLRNLDRVEKSMEAVLPPLGESALNAEGYVLISWTSDEGLRTLDDTLTAKQLRRRSVRVLVPPGGVAVVGAVPQEFAARPRKPAQ